MVEMLMSLPEKVDPVHTAVVVVDMQNAFVAPGALAEVPKARDITPNVKLIQDIRAQGGDAKDIVLVEGVRNGKPGKGQELQNHCTHITVPFLFGLPLEPE